MHYTVGYTLLIVIEKRYEKKKIIKFRINVTLSNVIVEINLILTIKYICLCSQHQKLSYYTFIYSNCEYCNQTGCTNRMKQLV